MKVLLCSVPVMYKIKQKPKPAFNHSVGQQSANTEDSEPQVPPEEK